MLLVADSPRVGYVISSGSTLLPPLRTNVNVDASFPVIFSGTGYIPPASAVNYVPWAIVGFIFQYVIRRRHFSWWAKYNYVLSAALDAGVAISAVAIFFCLQYPLNGDIGAGNVAKWWGNTVPFKTADARGTPMKVVAEGEFFGPRTWQ